MNTIKIRTLSCKWGRCTLSTPSAFCFPSTETHASAGDANLWSWRSVSTVTTRPCAPQIVETFSEELHVRVFTGSY